MRRVLADAVNLRSNIKIKANQGLHVIVFPLTRHPFTFPLVDKGGFLSSPHLFSHFSANIPERGKSYRGYKERRVEVNADGEKYRDGVSMILPREIFFLPPSLPCGSN